MGWPRSGGRSRPRRRGRSGSWKTNRKSPERGRARPEVGHVRARGSSGNKMTELEHFRHEKDAYFRRDPYSPIPAGERASFEGLKYFPEEPALRLTLLLERAET